MLANGFELSEELKKYRKDRWENLFKEYEQNFADEAEICVTELDTFINNTVPKALSFKKGIRRKCFKEQPGLHKWNKSFSHCVEKTRKFYKSGSCGSETEQDGEDSEEGVNCGQPVDSEDFEYTSFNTLNNNTVEKHLLHNNASIIASEESTDNNIEHIEIRNKTKCEDTVKENNRKTNKEYSSLEITLSKSYKLLTDDGNSENETFLKVRNILPKSKELKDIDNPSVEDENKINSEVSINKETKMKKRNRSKKTKNAQRRNSKSHEIENDRINNKENQFCNEMNNISCSKNDVVLTKHKSIENQCISNENKTKCKIKGQFEENVVIQSINDPEILKNGSCKDNSLFSKSILQNSKTENNATNEFLENHESKNGITEKYHLIHNISDVDFIKNFIKISRRNHSSTKKNIVRKSILTPDKHGCVEKQNNVGNSTEKKRRYDVFEDDDGAPNKKLKPFPEELQKFTKPPRPSGDSDDEFSVKIIMKKENKCDTQVDINKRKHLLTLRTLTLDDFCEDDI